MGRESWYANEALFIQLTAQFYSVEVILSLWIPKHMISPLQVGFEASNITQVSLQPSCARLWLKPHQLSDKLAIVTARGQWSPLQSEKIASLPVMEALMARRPFPKPIRAQEERNGPPSADQGLSTAKPRSSHVTWAQCWNPPTSPCHTLSDGTEPKSQGHCRKWCHELKVVWCIYVSISYIWLIYNSRFS